MQGTFHNIRMAGVASMVPAKVSNNIDLAEKNNEKVIKKQIRATGIERKHCVSGGQRAVDLGIGAAKKLLQQLDWNPEEIKVLIYASSYTIYAMPSTAFYIQSQLGIGVECNAFDINLACSGFVVGTEIVASLLQHCKEGEKGLLVVGINPSVDERKGSQNEIFLFGDAGGAAAFEVKDGCRMCFSQHSDGSRVKDLYKPRQGEPLHMDGMGVFNFTISEVADSINEFFSIFNLERKKVDYYFLHQAQKYIFDKLIDFCDLPAEKCPVSYRDFGNTGAVSIPLTMCYHQSEIDFSQKQNLFMSGFGAGLSWGNLWLETEQLVVLPVIYSDERVEEGE